MEYLDAVRGYFHRLVNITGSHSIKNFESYLIKSFLSVISTFKMLVNF